VALCVLGACGTGGTAAARDPERPRAGSGPERAYSVQLHLHGPLSEFNGSMEWHVRKAHEIGVDVLWWTDHDWRVALDTYTRRFDFENCVWDATLRRFVEPDTAGETRYFELKYAVPAHEKSVVDSLAYEGSRSLRLSVTGFPGSPLFQHLQLLQGASRRQNRYPLAVGARLSFALFAEELDPSNTKLVVQAKLSEHAAAWPVLRYVVGTSDGEDADAIVLPWTAGRWNTCDLDLAGDARRLWSLSGADTVFAQDNSLYEIMFDLAAREGARIVVFVDDLRYSIDEAKAGLSLLDWEGAAAGYYQSQVPDVLHHVGTEISRFRGPPHLNAYLPAPWLPDYAGHTPDDPFAWVVEQAHARGGVVSYNHPWGTGVYVVPPYTPEQRAARILAAKQEQLADRLYGCDLLEAGYRMRAGIDLAGHLDLWDCLTGNAIFVTGVGVTDSHGTAFCTGWTPWQPNERSENNYVTWLWATGTTETPLLSAMGAGRAYFGDPYRWSGELDLATTEGFPMGRVILTDKPAHDVVIRVTEAPEAAELRLAQGEIRSDASGAYTDVNWLRRETWSGADADGVLVDTVTVDASVPSFVRVELWDGDLDCAFSNPLHFVRSVPPEGIPARRLAASLGGLRVLRASDFVLRDARFDAEGETLTLVVEESAPGLGEVELDTAAYGPPAAVDGAASWTYEAGLLTARGLGGGTILVRWEGAPPPAPGEVALSAGRPNPFGEGLVAEYALPDPAQALLEVLDVRGRRVRVLEDSWRGAGRHPVSWDGRDAYGRSTAAGVYWLRLRALGVTRTTKAVKVR
jgi:hypothetical protein